MVCSISEIQTDDYKAAGREAWYRKGFLDSLSLSLEVARNDNHSLIVGFGGLFAGLDTQDAIDRVGRAASRLVVVAHLHLAEQSQRKQLHAGDNENRGRDEQWTVLVHHVRAPEDLHDH